MLASLISQVKIVRQTERLKNYKKVVMKNVIDIYVCVKLLSSLLSGSNVSKGLQGTAGTSTSSPSMSCSYNNKVSSKNC